MKKTVVLIVGGTEFSFSAEPQDLNNYINELMPNNKVAPARQFLMRTIESEQKDALKKLLDEGFGLEVELHSKVTEQLKGGLEISVKN